MDLQALKTELLAGHPDNGAYSSDSTNAAAELNAVNRPGQEDEMSAGSIFESIDISEYQALTAAKKESVKLLLTLGDEINISPASNARAWLLNTFPGGSTTRTNLLAAVSITVSRAVELNLGIVRAGHVELARELV